MAAKHVPLTYKGHPLRRKDSLIYYGSIEGTTSTYEELDNKGDFVTFY